MGIISYVANTAGQVGVNPRRVKIITTDSLATITTAGYLNNSVFSADPLSPTDILDIDYNYVASAQTYTYGEFTPNFVNGVITLVASAASDVVVPTIANHIAVFTNTSGQISEDVATAINGGNIQAGLSGTAGTVASFPSTAAKGSLVLAAVANTGNTVTTISNAAMGQASVLSIPDPGAATANIIISALSGAGTQHITSGSLGIDAGALISGITTGGQVGTLTLYPVTASKGSFNWNAANNSGNTATIFTTASYGQASTITFPDPAQATANGVLAPNALVSGNIVQASGTAGLVVDSGVAGALLGTFTVSVSLNQAAVQGAYATPFQLIAAPGAGKTIMVLNAAVYTNFQTSAFASGGVAIVQYANTVHGAGTNALSATIPAAEITAAASQIYSLNQATATVLTGITNAGIFFSNATGAFTGGSASSTVVITLTYQVITATV